MMKTSLKKIATLILLLLSIFSCPLYSVTTVSPNTPFFLVGYYGVESTFDVSLIQAALPFDIESDVVKRNFFDDTNNSSYPYTDTVRGLQFASYSLISNSSFSLTITHDKLTTSPGGDAPTEVDYRLDVVYGSASDAFRSCTAEPHTYTDGYGGRSFDTSIVIREVDADRTANNSIFSITDKKMYVSMIDTPEALSALKAGSYQSTITFEFTT